MFDYFKSSRFASVLFFLAVLVVLSGVFFAGVNIGERKGMHGVRWAEPYRKFIEPQRRYPFEQSLLPGGHSIFGIVVSSSSSTLVVLGDDQLERQISISSSTLIRMGRNAKNVKDVQVDERVAVFGAPTTDGKISARLIRLFGRK